MTRRALFALLALSTIASASPFEHSHRDSPYRSSAHAFDNQGRYKGSYTELPTLGGTRGTQLPQRTAAENEALVRQKARRLHAEAAAIAQPPRFPRTTEKILTGAVVSFHPAPWSPEPRPPQTTGKILTGAVRR